MSRRTERIRWFAHRVVRWRQNAELLGLRGDEVAELARRIEVAREAGLRRRAAIGAAREAAAEFDRAAGSAGRAGLRILKKIKAAAEADPEVWMVAGVKAGSGGQEMPLPPVGVEGAFLPDGSVLVRWRHDGVPGKDVSFVLERRLADRAGFRFLGITSDTEFRDTTIPAERSSVCYRMLTRCGTRVSEYSEVVQIDSGEQERAAA